MKKLSIVTAALLSVSAFSFAQDVNKLISKDDITRIIKTLSADDMQGRGTFTPGIEKAAQFIEREFKNIGLKPLAGATGFRQNIPITRVTPITSTVRINGNAISAENVCIYAPTASFSWSNASA